MVFLTLLLIGLLVLVFRKSALYIITGTGLNICLFLGLLILLSSGFPVYPATVFIFVCVAVNTLFYVNDVNEKTKAALVCVLLFLGVFTLLVLPLIQVMRVHGFGQEELEELGGFDFSVKVPFEALNTAIILMSFSGAVIDGSMAISSTAYELYHRGEVTSFSQLFKASLSIVGEVLSSTINTLLFAFMGTSLALVIWVQDLDYTFLTLINSKVFSGELLISIVTGTAAIAILPVSAAIASFLFFRKVFSEQEKETRD